MTHATFCSPFQSVHQLKSIAWYSLGRIKTPGKVLCFHLLRSEGALSLVYNSTTQWGKVASHDAASHDREPSRKAVLRAQRAMITWENCRQLHHSLDFFHIILPTSYFFSLLPYLFCVITLWVKTTVMTSQVSLLPRVPETPQLGNFAGAASHHQFNSQSSFLHNP